VGRQLFFDFIEQLCDVLFFRFTILSFSAQYEAPFPALVDGHPEDDLSSFPGPSVFNVSIVTPTNSSQNLQLIFNMDVLSRSTSNGLEFTTYKPTPYLPAETISFVLGRMDCRQHSPDSTVLKVPVPTCCFFKAKSLYLAKSRQ